MKQRHFIIIIVAALIIANIIVWGNRFLKKKPNACIQYYLKHPALRDSTLSNCKITLPAFSINNTDGICLNSKNLNHRFTVLIFFSLKDCSACLFEATYWSEAYKQYGQNDIAFYGITTDTDLESMHAFKKGYDILFPILQAPNSGIKNSILSLDRLLKDHLITPFKVFVNHKSEIVYIEGPKKGDDEQRGFLDIIPALVTLSQ